MDHAGAALGTVLASGLLWLLGTGAAGAASPAQLRTVFLCAAVPGVLAMVALALTPEPPRAMPAPGPAPRDQPLPPLLRRALLPLTLFAIANATDAFVLVKAARLGAPTALVPLLWLALQLIKAATATAGGRLADAHGKRNALLAGWCVYAVLWGSIGLVESLPTLFVLTGLYGTSHGLVEGAERALVADLAGGRAPGAAFGVYGMATGLASLVASAAFGLAWDRLGSAVAFAGSGAFALAAAATLVLLVPAAASGPLPAQPPR
jgi:MFS family permease